ncbi:MAG: hypothetical protein O7F76_11130 [Planctomycetota bacterium]|nr:hypothetical protein [Planctomycetota bacterium]
MPKRFFITVLSLALAAGVAATVVASPPADGGKSGQKPGETKPPKKKKPKKPKPPKNLARKVLKTVVDNAEFDDLPFTDFVDWLGRQTKANVVVRWKRLEAEGVERDIPIFLKRKNIKMSKLLRLVLDQVTEDLPDVQLAFRADGNVLTISTRKDLNAKLVVRTYDVQDLLLYVPNFQGRGVDLDGIGRGGARGVQRSGDGNGGEIKDPYAGLDARTRKLIMVITTTIEPDSWRINGGKGTIRFFQGKLVIRNNLDVHRKLAGALADDPQSGGE